MAPEKKSRAGRAKTSDWPPASDPNPTTASPSTSVATGGTASAPLLPSLALAIATNQPPPRGPPRSIQETHQEHISGTSVGTTTTADSASPSTAPSASAASTSTPPVLRPIMEEFPSRVVPKFISTMRAMERLRKMVPDGTGSQPRLTDWERWTLLEMGQNGVKEASDFVADMEELKGALEELVTQLQEKMRRDIGSGGSKPEGGGPDSGSGGGGQGGGVCACVCV